MPKSIIEKIKEGTAEIVSVSDPVTRETPPAPPPSRTLRIKVTKWNEDGETYETFLNYDEQELKRELELRKKQMAEIQELFSII